MLDWCSEYSLLRILEANVIKVDSLNWDSVEFFINHVQHSNRRGTKPVTFSNPEEKDGARTPVAVAVVEMLSVV